MLRGRPCGCKPRDPGRGVPQLHSFRAGCAKVAEVRMRAHCVGAQEQALHARECCQDAAHGLLNGVVHLAQPAEAAQERDPNSEQVALSDDADTLVTPDECRRVRIDTTACDRPRHEDPALADNAVPLVCSGVREQEGQCPVPEPLRSAKILVGIGCDAVVPVESLTCETCSEHPQRQPCVARKKLEEVLE